MVDYVNIIKLSLAHYWATKVRPFLILSDQIEIDETKASTGDYTHLSTVAMH